DGELFDRNDDRLSACEALHWVAFGELKTWEQYLEEDCLISARWGGMLSEESLEALAARVNPNPHCLIRQNGSAQIYNGSNTNRPKF
ncbi:MAG TPA: hypothetical protein VGA34_05995, partial [Alteraurantiacibacter sp.]